MREIFQEDGASEVVESMLILAITIIVFITVSSFVIRDFTSSNQSEQFSGFTINDEHISGNHKYLSLNLSYDGKPLAVPGTVLILDVGSSVFYIPMSDNDFSESSQWYPSGPVESGNYVIFNSSLSNAVPNGIQYNASEVSFTFAGVDGTIWSSGIFYSMPVITALSVTPSRPLPNESLQMDFYIYSSYAIQPNRVYYSIYYALNDTKVDHGNASPLNIFSSNEWYFPTAGSSPVSLPWSGSYYVTIVVYYHPYNSGIKDVSTSFSVVAR
jgi:hypothetical protein